MVFIWTKEKKDRLDIILLPEVILNDFIDTHIKRKFKLDEVKTCLVTIENDWNGIPSEERIISLLKEILDTFKIVKGFDIKLKIPPHFNDIKCRRYQMTRKDLISSDDIYDGFIKITFVKIDGRFNKTREELRNRPWINFSDPNKEELENTFKKFYGKYDKEFVFLIEHIHPSDK